MPRGFPIKRMKEIQEKIQNMDDDNQKAVLRIIQEDNVMYNETSTGVFFDIMTLKRETLDKITKLIDFYENCSQYLNERDVEQLNIKHDFEQVDDTNDDIDA
jgi:accessory colonization factor AcfC